MTNDKNAVISARIAALVAGGTDVQDAIDAVFGAGTFARIASEVHDGLTAELKTYRHSEYKGKRNYECGTVAVCRAVAAPNTYWTECEESIITLNKMKPLYIEAGVQYFGWL